MLQSVYEMFTLPYIFFEYMRYNFCYCSHKALCQTIKHIFVVCLLFYAMFFHIQPLKAQNIENQLLRNIGQKISNQSSNQPKKVLSKGREQLMGKMLDYFEDKNGVYTIEQMASPIFADKFIRSEKDILNFGFTSSVYWIRLQIEGAYRGENEYILEINYPLIDSLTIFRQNSEEQWFSSAEGDGYPFSKREIAHRNIAHQIRVPPQKTSTVFLRFKTQGSMQIPILLWKPKDFYNQAFNENMTFGILFGTLLVVVAYNIFLFWILQRAIHLHFSFMILISIVFLATLNGYAFKYLFAEQVTYANNALPVSVGLLTTLTCIFVIWILHIQKYSMFLYVLLCVLSVIGVFTMISPLLLNYNFAIKFGLLNGLLASLLSFLSSIICRLQGGLQARYLIPASYLYLIGIVLVYLKSFGAIETTFISTHAVELGSVFQAIFFSLALRERYQV